MINHLLQDPPLSAIETRAIYGKIIRIFKLGQFSLYALGNLLRGKSYGHIRVLPEALNQRPVNNP
jgi:hypothetical protein